MSGLVGWGMARRLRPGSDCPKCSSVLKSHCAHCDWLECVRCKAYGPASAPERFVSKK